jgi:membrane associated rhomboid family serine protease
MTLNPGYSWRVYSKDHERIKLMANLKSTRFYQSLIIPLRFIALLWIIQLLQFILPVNFGWLGVFPGRIFGLKGILFSPLIHADFGHLLSNTAPLLVLSTMVMFFYRKVALRAFVMIYLLTGLAVWLFGRPVFHIGASGVVYGLVAFVFWSGIFRRNLKAIVLALIVVFYYGSMVMGILPGQEGISWESHLLGGIVGIFTAFWFRGQLEGDEKPNKYSWELEEGKDAERFFLDRDTFEQTREERMQERERDWFSF